MRVGRFWNLFPGIPIEPSLDLSHFIDTDHIAFNSEIGSPILMKPIEAFDSKIKNS